MKILILGSTGMLGYNLEKVLQRNSINYNKTSRKKSRGCIKFDAIKDDLNIYRNHVYLKEKVDIVGSSFNQLDIPDSFKTNYLIQLSF